MTSLFDMTTFELRHYFEPSYFDTVDELEKVYQPMIKWLDQNIKGAYKLDPMDNAAFSDINEDPWIGYYISFGDEEDAMAFKLRWA